MGFYLLLLFNKKEKKLRNLAIFESYYWFALNWLLIHLILIIESIWINWFLLFNRFLNHLIHIIESIWNYLIFIIDFNSFNWMNWFESLDPYYLMDLNLLILVIVSIRNHLFLIIFIIASIFRSLDFHDWINLNQLILMIESRIKFFKNEIEMFLFSFSIFFKMIIYNISSFFFNIFIFTLNKFIIFIYFSFFQSHFNFYML